jgi:zinc protease
MAGPQIAGLFYINFHGTVAQGEIMKWLNALLLSCFLLVSSFQASPAGQLPGDAARNQWCRSSGTWPHEQSDLPPDPALVFGRLDNGFRYVLMKNQEPKGRVAMYLNVQAGSLMETDEQRGIAHFLEHMLFNGTTHFPPGALIDYFQSIGMSFGGDTNAHTGFDETVYNILLSGTSPEELDKGLLVMADYARGALLSDTEIERERGVILSEKRARDSVEFRTQEAGLAFTMRGSRVPSRMPIGVLETLEKADRARMKSYYDGWYRPEKMILVVVGDLDPGLVAPRIREHFGSMRGEGAIPDCPPWGEVNHSGTEFFYHHEPEMGFTEVSIETIWNEPEAPDTLASQTAEIHREAAGRILKYRLARLLEKKDIPFTSSEAHSGIFLGRIGYGSISARTNPGQWQSALAVIEQELRQALEFGFTDSETTRVRKEMLAGLDSAVLTAATRDSQKLAAKIVRDLNGHKVSMSPQQEKEIFAPVIGKMQAKELHAALRGIWNQRARLIQLVGNTELSGKDPLAQIREVYERAVARKVEPPKAGAELVFPYLHLTSDPGSVQEQPLSEVEGERIRFANGVVVNLKRTPFKDNEVQLVAHYGYGRQTEPVPGLAMLAEQVVNESGTGKLSKSDLEGVLAGSTVKLDFKVGESSFIWKGSAVGKDLELLFQLLQARLVDPAVREDAYVLAMQGFKQMYEQMNSDVNGFLQLSGESFLAGGNSAFGLPPWSEFARLKPEQIRAWMDVAPLSGGLEVSLVGDFDPERVRELARRYLAPLPQRGQEKAAVEQISFPAGQTLRLTVPSSIDKALLVVAWPTADFWNIERTRGLYLLTEVFADRLRKVIREKLGATYSPQVMNQPSRVYPGYGVLRAQLIVNPAQIAAMREEVTRVAADLWKSGVTAEELVRARLPVLTSLKDMVRTNGYWLNSVLSLSSRYPQQLQWPATILSGFESITGDQVSALAREYLDPARAASVMIVPEKQ